MWNATAMTQPLAELVGMRVREARAARGWSLSSLAARAGIGKATLSQIEAGRRNATLETLYAIAAQLGVGLAALLAEAPEPVVRGAAVEARLLAVYRDAGTTTELYRIRLEPGRRQVSPYHGPGVVEHLVVTAGRLRLGPIGEEVVVAAGEDRVFEPHGPHAYAAEGDEPAEAVLLMRHPAT
jgi:XRE family transcriptional regulator, regulator of sulfur utilization